MLKSPRKVFHFRDFELDVAAYELRRQGRAIRLERQPMDLLILLVERRGLLVARDEIVDQLWGKDVFVDVETGIHTAIRKIRQALRDSVEKPVFVETISGKGYRFIAPVEVEADVGDPAAPVMPLEPVPAPAPTTGAATARISEMNRLAHLQAPASSNGEAAGRRLGGASPRAAIAVTAALALVLALASWLALESRRSRSHQTSKLPRLAVLPFEDLGAPENAYFAAGMTEELIAGLATIQGLEVVSRITVTQYRRAGKQLREIGHDLGVDYILEGTVRWDRGSGQDRVRITPQLIRVADDTHLWAGEYDRNLADVFAVQSDIAQHVVQALGVTLSARERRVVEVPLTRNPEAYQLYLRGLRTLDAPFGTELLTVADLMHRAAELDPGFALAHAREARALVLNYFLGGPRENRERARAALARAQAVAPDDPRVRLAAGWVYYQGDGDYGRALLEFEAAERAMPNNGEVPYGIGAVLRRLGHYEEALDRFARARELGTPEPSWSIDRSIALTNWALRRYPEADRVYEQLLRVAPDIYLHWSERAWLQLDWKGDPAAARAALAGAPPTLDAQLVGIRVLIETWDRRFAEAVALAQPHLDEQKLPADELDEWYIAYAYLRLGRSREAKDLAHRIITAREEELAASPDSVVLHRLLAETYALVGAREPALMHARKAIALTANDAGEGLYFLDSLAAVYTLLGDHEQALALLPGLLDKAYHHAPLNNHRLRGEPWWDPLRGDPRFEQLLADADADAASRALR